MIEEVEGNPSQVGQRSDKTDVRWANNTSKLALAPTERGEKMARINGRKRLIFF